MASTKLTKYMREKILTEVLAHKFKDQYLALCSEYCDLTNAVYEDLYSEADIKKMYSLPKGWLKTTASISVKFAGKYTQLTYGALLPHNDFYEVFKVSRESIEEKPCPYKDAGECRKVYEATDLLAQRYEGLETKLSEMKIEYNKVKALTQSTLDNVTTVQALINRWPEIEPFAKKHIYVADRTVPALPVEKLNQMLNLPIEEKKHARN